VLAGRVLPGWNYVEDNANSGDVAASTDDNNDGVADSAFGHGTFVSGMVSLVAPDAQILPERVLDSDGFGNEFIVAQAILDAVDSGADVINISFGTAARLTSPVINDALQVADRHNVVIVAAAGNDASSTPHYPAATSPVLGVAATRGGTSRDLTSFSDWGDWVAVAAPGQFLVGPVPGGKFVKWSGTSMAAPLVAGQAALVRAAAPKLSGHDVADMIRHTAYKDATHRVRFGAINPLPSLRSALARH
jgi:subtilisin family serine protease